MKIDWYFWTKLGKYWLYKFCFLELVMRIEWNPLRNYQFFASFCVWNCYSCTRLGGFFSYFWKQSGWCTKKSTNQVYLWNSRIDFYGICRYVGGYGCKFWYWKFYPKNGLCGCWYCGIFCGTSGGFLSYSLSVLYDYFSRWWCSYQEMKKYYYQYTHRCHYSYCFTQFSCWAYKF